MKRICSLLLALAILLSLCACKKLPESSESILYAMDTQMDFRLYGDDDGAAAQSLGDLIAGLELELSATDNRSDLSMLNRLGSSTNADILALLRAAQTLSARTDGALDPTIYPLVKLWGFTADAYRIPREEELESTLKLVGLGHVHLYDDHVELDDDTMLDFGALAKGYAADLCRAELEKRQLTGILSLGGNIQTVGEKPDKTPWTIGVQDPDDPAAYVVTLAVEGTRAVVTSGDYQRYFEYDGTRYCHIFDPATGCPVQGELRSVTVVAESGLLADGLSTALFVMGYDKGAALWRESDDFECIWLFSDGRVRLTQGLEQAASGCAFTVVRR